MVTESAALETDSPEVQQTNDVGEPLPTPQPIDSAMPSTIKLRNGVLHIAPPEYPKD